MAPSRPILAAGRDSIDVAGVTMGSLAIDRQQWPAFLVGCHRSGTTLVRYLLDAHPRLACPPESKFIAGIEAFLRYPQTAEALHFLGATSDIWIGLRSLISIVLDGYARRHNKLRWIDKTPNYYRILPLIDQIFDHHVLYLLMVRHPLDCISSLEEAPSFTAPLDSQQDPDVGRVLAIYGHNRCGWARYWVEVNSSLHRFACLAPTRCLLFRYEDLVNSPDAVVGTIGLFLDESMPPRLIEDAFLVEHSLGYEDWKIRQTHSILTSRVGKWASWSDEEVQLLWEIVGPIATRCGYSPDQAVLTSPTELS
jgi:protein-tyrosine sulfotransferase